MPDYIFSEQDMKLLREMAHSYKQNNQLFSSRESPPEGGLQDDPQHQASDVYVCCSDIDGYNGLVIEDFLGSGTGTWTDYDYTGTSTSTEHTENEGDTAGKTTCGIFRVQTDGSIAEIPNLEKSIYNLGPACPQEYKVTTKAKNGKWLIGPDYGARMCWCKLAQHIYDPNEYGRELVHAGTRCEGSSTSSSTYEEDTGTATICVDKTNIDVHRVLPIGCVAPVPCGSDLEEYILTVKNPMNLGGSKEDIAVIAYGEYHPGSFDWMILTVYHMMVITGDVIVDPPDVFQIREAGFIIPPNERPTIEDAHFI